MCYGILGHHRMLNLVQEFGMIVTFLVMGVLVMRPKPDKLCEITSIAMYALMIFIILLSLMTASIARRYTKHLILKHSSIQFNPRWKFQKRPISIRYLLLLAGLSVNCYRSGCLLPVEKGF